MYLNLAFIALLGVIGAIWLSPLRVGGKIAVSVTLILLLLIGIQLLGTVSESGSRSESVQVDAGTTLSPIRS